MSFVEEILSQSSHIKRRRIVELFDYFLESDDDSTVKIYLDDEETFQELWKDKLPCKKRQLRMSHLIASVNRSFRLEEEWFELVLLLLDEFSEKEHECFMEFVYSELNEDAWNSTAYDLLFLLTGINTELAEEVIRYYLDLIDDGYFLEYFLAFDSCPGLYGHAAENSYSNLRTLMEYTSPYEKDRIRYEDLLVRAVDDPQSFEYILEQVENLLEFLVRRGGLIVKSLKEADNWKTIKLFLEALRNGNILKMLRTAIRHSRPYHEFLTKEDLKTIDQWFLEDEYLSVAEPEMEHGNEELGFPLPTLVLGVVGDETNRRLREHLGQ